MVRRIACIGALVAVLCAVTAAQVVRTPTGNVGLAVCVGVDKYPVLGDAADARKHAQAVGQKLKGAGYQSVRVLLARAEDWEFRATVGNIRSEVWRMAQLAQPGDRVLVHFAGHVTHEKLTRGDAHDF